MTYGMIIDLRKCIGCNACSMACKQHNGTAPGLMRSKVMKYEEGTYPNTHRRSVPTLCMQCENPSCVDACPTGATYKDTKTGIVFIDKDKCIGCKSCMMACPYSAHDYRKDDQGYFGAALTPFEKVKYADMPAGVVDKCTFRYDDVIRGEQPACVRTCMTQCRIFGDMDDLKSQIALSGAQQLKPETGNDPNVYYIF